MLMRQMVIGLSLLGSLLIFALTVDLFDTIVLFLLFGILPGRTAPLSPDQMLTIYAVISVFVIALSLKDTVVPTLSSLRSNLPRFSRQS